jgi:NADPH2:quinone reductase
LVRIHHLSIHTSPLLPSSPHQHTLTKYSRRKLPEWLDATANTGDDIAGIVHSVGSNVWEFKPGDRVASFHEMTTPGGSFAEYAVGWQHTTFHIPKKTSFEDAAAIPLAAMTAALGLHLRLDLPEPWKPAKEKIPLVVYGGASAVGGEFTENSERINQKAEKKLTMWKY